MIDDLTTRTEVPHSETLSVHAHPPEKKKEPFSIKGLIRRIAIWWKSKQEKPQYYPIVCSTKDEMQNTVLRVYIYADERHMVLLDTMSMTMTDVNREGKW